MPLVRQHYLVSESLHTVPGHLSSTVTLFCLTWTPRQDGPPSPCQGKPCKGILVRARAESKECQACDTCISCGAKSNKAWAEFRAHWQHPDLSMEPKCETCHSSLVPIVIKSTTEGMFHKRIPSFDDPMCWSTLNDRRYRSTLTECEHSCCCRSKPHEPNWLDFFWGGSLVRTEKYRVSLDHQMSLEGKQDTQV